LLTIAIRNEETTAYQGDKIGETKLLQSQTKPECFLITNDPAIVLGGKDPNTHQETPTGGGQLAENNIVEDLRVEFNPRWPPVTVMLVTLPVLDGEETAHLRSLPTRCFAA
jgi:hypothetical protein